MIENEDKLLRVEVDLVRTVRRAAKIIPIRVLEGRRSIERQKELIKKGASKLSDPTRGSHVLGYAVDLVPLPFEGWGDWENLILTPVTEHGFPAAFDEKERKRDLDNVAKKRGKFYFLAGVMKACAKQSGIELRWGGDWDGDNRFLDNGFDDLVHFEIR